jgi:putative methyltransferase (TIGR04325 family)
MTVAYALCRALSAGHASVLDWGGGLGYYAALAGALFPDCRFEWTVKELPALCAAARALLPEVVFLADEDTALARRYDLVLASNSLQYAQDWSALVGRFAAATRRWVLLTKLPVVSGAASYVVVQRPHFAGYLTEYISWVLNRGELLAAARAHGLGLVREFMLERRPYPIRRAPEQCDIVGYLFERRS